MGIGDGPSEIGVIGGMEKISLKCGRGKLREGLVLLHLIYL